MKKWLVINVMIGGETAVLYNHFLSNLESLILVSNALTSTYSDKYDVIYQESQETHIKTIHKNLEYFFLSRSGLVIIAD